MKKLVKLSKFKNVSQKANVSQYTLTPEEKEIVKASYKTYERVRPVSDHEMLSEFPWIFRDWHPYDGRLLVDQTQYLLDKITEEFGEENYVTRYPQYTTPEQLLQHLDELLKPYDIRKDITDDMIDFWVDMEWIESREKAKEILNPDKGQQFATFNKDTGKYDYNWDFIMKTQGNDPIERKVLMEWKKFETEHRLNEDLQYQYWMDPQRSDYTFLEEAVGEERAIEFRESERNVILRGWKINYDTKKIQNRIEQIFSSRKAKIMDRMADHIPKLVESSKKARESFLETLPDEYGLPKQLGYFEEMDTKHKELRDYCIMEVDSEADFQYALQFEQFPLSNDEAFYQLTYKYRNEELERQHQLEYQQLNPNKSKHKVPESLIKRRKQIQGLMKELSDITTQSKVLENEVAAMKRAMEQEEAEKKKKKKDPKTTTKETVTVELTPEQVKSKQEFDRQWKLFEEQKAVFEAEHEKDQRRFSHAYKKGSIPKTVTKKKAKKEEEVKDK